MYAGEMDVKRSVEQLNLLMIKTQNNLDLVRTWWDDYYISGVTFYLNPTLKHSLTIYFSCPHETADQVIAKMQGGYRLVIEYVNQSSICPLMIVGTKTPFSRMHLNQICKIVASVDDKTRFRYVNFDCNIKFGKLINSMCSIPQILFDSCDIDFKGNCKINQSKRYAWTQIVVHNWNFMNHSFAKFIRML